MLYLDNKVYLVSNQVPRWIQNIQSQCMEIAIRAKAADTAISTNKLTIIEVDSLITAVQDLHSGHPIISFKILKDFNLS